MGFIALLFTAILYKTDKKLENGAKNVFVFFGGMP